ncbi:MAG: Signal peptidase I W [Firmicutes bacterium ADurb.Bin080]|jgi:signal peptidase|nr:signal peptidase I [Clostridiales bacterium]OQC14059.1 MAG: Signal peptidase I W [Firmicutes bacterium ADurb.Bin080]
MFPLKIRINDKTKKTLIVCFKVIAIIICALLVLLILANLSLIIKGAINPETPPSVIGLIPLSVMSDSMDTGEVGAIKSGDLIIIQAIKEGNIIEVNEIIAFLTEDNVVITHRVVEISEDSQGKYYITKGDANNNVDMEINGEPAKVRDSSIIGLYSSKIKNLGYISLALQTPIGLVLFLGIPVLLIIVYDLLRRKIAKNKLLESSKNTQPMRLIEAGNEDTIHIILADDEGKKVSEDSLSDEVTEKPDK